MPIQSKEEALGWRKIFAGNKGIKISGKPANNCANLFIELPELNKFEKQGLIQCFDIVDYTHLPHDQFAGTY